MLRLRRAWRACCKPFIPEFALERVFANRFDENAIKRELRENFRRISFLFAD
jgi:hypothetical protein